MFDAIRKSKRRAMVFALLELIIIALLITGYYLYPDFFVFLESQEIFYGSVGGLFLINIFFIIIQIRSYELAARQNYIAISNTLGADISEAYRFGEIGLINYDAKKTIVWTSDLFQERNLNLLGQSVDSVLPELRVFFSDVIDKPTDIKVELNQRIYTVINLAELKILIFKDVTELDHLYELRSNEASVVATIVLDNLVDIVSVANDENTVQIEQAVRKAIIDWAKDNEILIRKVKEDVYIAFMQETIYSRLAKEQFRLLSTIKTLNVNANSDINFTISIGFGRGTLNFLKLAELSASAIDVAMSRGGNQVVVNNYGSHMDFYGSSSDVRTKRNAVRTRILAQSFYAHLQTNSTIYIVPHSDADFDAIGAALGVLALAKSAGKQAFIVYDENQIEVKTRAALKEMFIKNELDLFTISPAKAYERVNQDTLVVAVDVHRPVITTAPKLLEKATRVAIIDHHRRAEDSIDNPVFNIIEPTASSTCEIVIELIRYNKSKIKISPKIATMMLAGILLDTNGFKTHTNTSTYEAAMILKEYGADNTVAENFLKDEYEEYVLKNKIMNNIETPYFGLVITTAPSDQIISRTILAKVGQEAMGVKGIKAIFVIGRIDEKTVGISARSDGSINVMLITEKFGGGGHFSGAACQIQNTSIDEVKKQLLRYLELYINEISHE